MLILQASLCCDQNEDDWTCQDMNDKGLGKSSVHANDEERLNQTEIAQEQLFLPYQQLQNKQKTKRQ